MFLIVGLGNPEYEYEYTRHNFGFLVVDALAERLSITKKPIADATRAAWLKIKADNSDLILAKPLTYMNESGQAVKSLLTKFEIYADNLIIIHDDLDLELGSIRIKKGSSSGGHLGVESVVKNIGTRDFIRIRLGIGRPPAKKDPSLFVLEPFKKKEVEAVEFASFKAADAIIDLLNLGLEEVMNKYN